MQLSIWVPESSLITGLIPGLNNINISNDKVGIELTNGGQSLIKCTVLIPEEEEVI